MRVSTPCTLANFDPGSTQIHLDSFQLWLCAHDHVLPALHTHYLESRLDVNPLRLFPKISQPLPTVSSLREHPVFSALVSPAVKRKREATTGNTSAVRKLNSFRRYSEDIQTQTFIIGLSLTLSRYHSLNNVVADGRKRLEAIGWNSGYCHSVTPRQPDRPCGSPMRFRLLFFCISYPETWQLLCSTKKRA